ARVRVVVVPPAARELGGPSGEAHARAAAVPGLVPGLRVRLDVGEGLLEQRNVDHAATSSHSSDTMTCRRPRSLVAKNSRSALRSLSPRMRAARSRTCTTF